MFKRSITWLLVITMFFGNAFTSFADNPEAGEFVFAETEPEVGTPSEAVER